MKKPQRSFVVEYKSGRRKADSKAPSSIWGNLDLKSVARDVEPVLPSDLSGSDNIMSSEPAKLPKELAPAIHLVEHRAPISTSVDVAEPSQYETPTAGEASAAPEASEVRQSPDNDAPELQVSKPRMASRRRVPASRPLPEAANNTSLEHDADVDNLEQLEEENRRLKVMLAAKLRKENSWLRKRLLL
ncbi:hypothetical protein [Rhizobium sp.]|uniref:hypothetical protein n=1 Tax=Rhizobium sp. TaxID=391 RepID=UPI00289C32E1